MSLLFPPIEYFVTHVMHSKRSEQFGVLAKHWSPGLAKTRLASFCGDQKAAELHRVFLTATLRRFATIGDRRVLSFTPEERRADFEKVAGKKWTLLPQGSGDLGTRITDYFQEAFSVGSHRVLLVGADAPSLPTATVSAAFSALADHDLTFVPSDDGGYCLIGASRPVGPLMTNIDWGSTSVWAQTQEKIAGLKWSAVVLPSWYDVDREKDLVRLVNELAPQLGETRPGHDTSDANLSWLYGQIIEICEKLRLPRSSD